MAEKNKLSIYLVKDEFSASDQTILKNGAEMLAELENVGRVYYSPSQTHGVLVNFSAKNTIA